MFTQGVILKNDKFLTGDWISRSRLIQFSRDNFVKNRHEPLLQQWLHHDEVESYARNAAQRSSESTSILNGEQPETIEYSGVALNDPRCVARAHPTAALSDWHPGLLN